MASGSIRVSVELGLHELYAPLRIAERLSEPCRGNANADSGRPKGECSGGRRGLPPQSPLSPRHVTARSEERRVGKECRSRWAREHYTKKDHESVVWVKTALTLSHSDDLEDA